MYFEIAADGRIMICAEEKVFPHLAELTPPAEFVPDEQHDWRVEDGQFIYDPLPVEDPAPTDAERITQLEEALDLLLSGEVGADG